jgi:hypothetical protein
MPKTRKKTYHILVNRYALHEFRVDAGSYEDACKILGRELRAGTLKKAKATGTVEPHWADPADKGDEWVVMCATPEPGQTHTRLLAWNGKKVMDSRVLPSAPFPLTLP